jgi:hypothetical protein
LPSPLVAVTQWKPRAYAGLQTSAQETISRHAHYEGSGIGHRRFGRPGLQAFRNGNVRP